MGRYRQSEVPRHPTEFTTDGIDATAIRDTLDAIARSERELLRGEVDAFMANRAERTEPRNLPFMVSIQPGGRGLLGDRFRSADDLAYIAALYVCVGERNAEARATVVEAAAHQERHVATLAEIAKDPELRDAVKVRKSLQPNPEAFASYVEHSQRRLRLLASAAAAESDDACFALLEEAMWPNGKLRRTEFVLMHALTMPLVHRLRERRHVHLRHLVDVCAGEDDWVAHAGEFCARVGTPFSERELRDMWLLLHVPERLHVPFVTRFPSTMADQFRASRGTAGSWKEPGRIDMHEAIARAATVGELERLWYGVWSQASEVVFGTGNCRLVAAVSRDLLRSMVAGGAEPVIFPLEPYAARGWSTLRHLPPRYYEPEAILGARRLFALPDGRFVVCVGAYRLDTRTDGGLTRDELVEAASRSRALPRSFDLDGVALDEQWDGAAAGRYAGDISGEFPTFPAALGPIRCDHPEGWWYMTSCYGHDDTSGQHANHALADNGLRYDALRLACSSCVQRAVVALPAHRLPDGHPLLEHARRNEETYLAVDQAHAVLRRVAYTPAASLDALRTRDGVASLDPADYATVRNLPELPSDTLFDL